MLLLTYRLLLQQFCIKSQLTFWVTQNHLFGQFRQVTSDLGYFRNEYSLLCYTFFCILYCSINQWITFVFLCACESDCQMSQLYDLCAGTLCSSCLCVCVCVCGWRVEWGVALCLVLTHPAINCVSTAAVCVDQGQIESSATGPFCFSLPLGWASRPRRSHWSQSGFSISFSCSIFLSVFLSLSLPVLLSLSPYLPLFFSLSLSHPLSVTTASLLAAHQTVSHFKSQLTMSANWIPVQTHSVQAAG